MNWFVYALVSSLVLSASEFSQKISLSQKINISAITNNFFVWLLQGFAGFILAIVFTDFNFSFSNQDFLRLVILAFIYFIGGSFYYTSFKSNSPSISMIMVSFSAVVSTILGIFFFNESTVFTKFMGILLILISITIVNFNKKLKFDKYNIYALIGAICFGFAYSLDKSFAIKIHPFIYVGLMSTSVGLLSFILKPVHIYQDFKRMTLKNFYPIFSTAFFGTLFNTFTFLSYQHQGNVGIIDAINNSSVFPVIILEILILKDRTNLPKKIIASFLVCFGIFLLSTIK